MSISKTGVLLNVIQRLLISTVPNIALYYFKLWCKSADLRVAIDHWGYRRYHTLAINKRRE